MSVVALDQHPCSGNGAIKVRLGQIRTDRGCRQHQTGTLTPNIRHRRVGSIHKLLGKQLPDRTCVTKKIEQGMDSLWLWPRWKKGLVDTGESRPAQLK